MELNASPCLFDIHAPRLEDAGLEDSALPTHSIEEAFRRAADALQNAHQHVHTAANGILGSIGAGEEFVKNPGPSNGLWEDSCVEPKGIVPLGEEQSCVDMKAGGLIEEGHDLVIVQEADWGEVDKVVIGKEWGPSIGDDGCVEGLADGGKIKDSPGGTVEGPTLVLA